MSVEAVHEFLGKVQQDEALQQQVKSVLKPGNRDATRVELVRLGSEAGFTFSTDDYDAAIAKLREDSESGEIADDALEAVSGGAYLTFSYSSLLRKAYSPSGIMSSTGLLGTSGLGMSG